MKKPALAVSAILLLAIVPVWAGKFWQEGDFMEWTEKDVIKMLTKSPWSRQITIGVRRSQGVTGTTMRTGRRDGPRAGASSGSRGGGFGRGRGGSGRGGFSPSMTLTVRWLSSAPVKQAVARARFGDAAKTAPMALKLLEPEQNHYIIGVSGLPARMAQMPPERQKFLFERMKSETILKIKGRGPIPAKDVRFGSDQGQTLDAKTGQAGVEFFIFFPKEEITLKHKNVEFITRLMDRKVSRKFKLKDMVFQGELEL